MKKISLWLALGMIPLYGFWIIPQSKTAQANQQAVEALKSETLSYQNKLKQLKDLDTLLADERYEGVLEKIPSKLEQAELILQLQNLAEKTGFVFDGLSFNRGQDAEIGASTLEVNFAVRGRAENFASFLAAVEESPRFMGLRSFAYSVETINGLDVISLSVPLYTLAQSSEN